jgi:hypothetical protein
VLKDVLVAVALMIFLAVTLQLTLGPAHRNSEEVLQAIGIYTSSEEFVKTIYISSKELLEATRLDISDEEVLQHGHLQQFLESLPQAPLHTPILTIETFDDFVRQHEYAFIHFYVPWSTWGLIPIWNDFSVYVTSNNADRLGVASVDCVAQPDLCREQKLRAYPTLRWFSKGQAVVPDYAEDRSVPSLARFAHLRMYPGQAVAPPPLYEGWDGVRSYKRVFVRFDFGRDSQVDVNVWAEFARVMTESSRNVVVARVRCNTYPQWCGQNQEIRLPGRSTLRWFQDGKPVTPDYQGDRSVAALTEFVDLQRSLEL